jgi:hypothetical protein
MQHESRPRVRARNTNVADVFSRSSSELGGDQIRGMKSHCRQRKISYIQKLHAQIAIGLNPSGSLA